jgi:hypothetical protein
MQKPFIKSLFTAVVTALAVALSPTLFGQGVVSSGMSGTLFDEAGQPVSGATVTVVHVPTNTTATAITSPSGRFSVSGLRVGGPYTVSATSPNYTINPVEGIVTSLGEEADVILIARSETLQLEKLVISGEQSDLNANATGAGSVVDNRRILNQPTSNRSFADMMKTNPFISIRAFPQVTALGMNNRYNSITLDGARINDQFGLASSGLFSLKNPFSLDAVENFSLDLAPYDVTQSGFAGASVNVVSKSGTNEFHGSAYYIYTSYKWQGEDLSGTNAGKRPAPFYERIFGATLGGPIIKDRLFFFLNYEKLENPSAGPSNAGFTPDAGVLSNLDAQIAALPGAPDLGEFGGANNLTDDEKILAKLDWNITKDHRLTLRYSTTEGTQAFFPNFNTTGISSPAPPGISTSGYNNGVTSYNSNFYNLAVNEEVWATQLFSRWTPNFSTEIAASTNDTSSLRSTPAIFPEIIIRNVPGTSSTGAAISTQNALLVGTDVSSMGNGVITEALSYRGNATYIWKDFTFKAGFDHEETDFNNLFRSGSYGVFAYDYSPTLSLANDRPIGFIRGVAAADYPATDIGKLEQSAVFAQVKWEPNRRFNLTAGLRYDWIGSPIPPPYNPAFSAAFNPYYPGIRNDGTIDGTDQLAPRLGFNYQLDSERTTQIRGGVGVFLGRAPWVWMSNSYGNAGYGRFNISNTNATAPTLGQYLGGTYTNPDTAYKFDPADPLGTTSLSPASAGTPAINMLEPGLKLPTNLRGNLALDHKIKALDAVFTVEWIHNDVMEAMFYDNLNLKVLNGDSSTNRPTAASYGADGRLRFATNAAGNGGAANAPLVTGWANVLRLSNTGVGSSDYISFMLDRPLKNGWAYNIAYTRGRATEAQPAGSSTASSQWGFNIVFNQGQVEEERADYEITDRVQINLSKEFNFLGRFKTIASLYYEGRSGQPFSYVYSGDLNRDGQNANDTLSVPDGLGDSRFDFSGMNAAQQSAYFAYLDESGLSRYAGGHAPRNAFTTAWQNRLDLHLSQEVHVAGSTSVELFADFINFGSWISEDLFNYVETINTTTTNSNQNRALGNATYAADGRVRPTVALNSDGTINFPSASQLVPNNGDSRWRITAGVRLKF